MRITQTIESVFIIIALVSLWPLLAGHRSGWYTLWLILMLALMTWVAVRRLKRIRSAAQEAKRKHDQAPRPPRLHP